MYECVCTYLYIKYKCLRLLRLRAGCLPVGMGWGMTEGRNRPSEAYRFETGRGMHLSETRDA
jgi:hypothetical protein